MVDSGRSPAGETGTSRRRRLRRQRVHLADMNGDGLQDLVRVGSGRSSTGRGSATGASARASSWPTAPAYPAGARPGRRRAGRRRRRRLRRPGVGHGRRARRRDQPQRRHAPVARIAPLPAPLPGTLRAVNMNGGPGAGLLWCSLRFGRPAYVQVEFSPGEVSPGAAPYLLTSVDNGSGLRSELSYRPAVEDYLRDAGEGRAWTTHLPLPAAGRRRYARGRQRLGPADRDRLPLPRRALRPRNASVPRLRQDRAPGGRRREPRHAAPCSTS